MKFAGAGRGVGLTGLLGGLVSNTAVTLSFSRRSHEARHLSLAGVYLAGISCEVESISNSAHEKNEMTRHAGVEGKEVVIKQPSGWGWVS